MTDLAASASRIWYGDGALASLARAALLPASALFRLATTLRNGAYDAGLLRSARLPLPSIGVGNLAVGGAGKTPIAAALTAALRERGGKPAVLLRGYGGDETRVHELLSPGTPVFALADRLAGARKAAALGADSLVLDDVLQHRRVRSAVMIAVVAAETWRAVRWPLPSGPWREGVGALRRADAVVVTVKSASTDRGESLARALAARTSAGIGIVARLEIEWLEDGTGERSAAPDELRGREVLAVCGIGNPDAFLTQLAGMGARVRSAVFGDHHRYTAAEARALALEAPSGGMVVTTVKDAVKLRPLWPRGTGSPALLTARQAVRVVVGTSRWDGLIERIATAARAINQGAAAAPFVSER